jgi:hypothetical protein
MLSPRQSKGSDAKDSTHAFLSWMFPGFSLSFCHALRETVAKSEYAVEKVAKISDIGYFIAEAF